MGLPVTCSSCDAPVGRTLGPRVFVRRTSGHLGRLIVGTGAGIMAVTALKKCAGHAAHSSRAIRAANTDGGGGAGRTIWAAGLPPTKSASGTVQAETRQSRPNGVQWNRHPDATAA